MKCDRCNGKGKTTEYDGLRKFFCDYKCPVCDGTGEFDPNEVDRFNAVDFIKVMEMVKNPQTNEEMLRGCTFEEMAGAIYEWYSLGYSMGKRGKKLNPITEVVGWLKEPHKE